MIDLLSYPFFQNALFGSVLISFVCGIVGAYIVVRRLVFISGGITHASFGGLGLGFYLGVNPIVTAVLFAVGAVFGVELMSRRLKEREDSAIAVMWSLGMALGILFVFITPGYTPGLSEFLFGNILTITHADLLVYAVLALLLMLILLFGYRTLLYTAFDRDFARTQNLPVRAVELVMMIFVAVTIVLSIRLIGIVLLMSVLTIPQMIANLFTYDLKRMMLLSVFLSLGTSVAALFLSYLVSAPTGALMILLLTILYIVVRIARRSSYKFH